MWNTGILPANDVRGLFKRTEKGREEKLWGQVNDNLTEDILTD